MGIREDYQTLMEKQFLTQIILLGDVVEQLSQLNERLREVEQ